jgi:hypothetical protein
MKVIHYHYLPTCIVYKELLYLCARYVDMGRGVVGYIERLKCNSLWAILRLGHRTMLSSSVCLRLRDIITMID